MTVLTRATSKYQYAAVGHRTYPPTRRRSNNYTRSAAASCIVGKIWRCDVIVQFFGALVPRVSLLSVLLREEKAARKKRKSRLAVILLECLLVYLREGMLFSSMSNASLAANVRFSVLFSSL